MDGVASSTSSLSLEAGRASFAGPEKTQKQPQNGGLVNLAQSQTFMGMRNRFIRPTEDIFNANDRSIRDDIVRMISQFLGDEGFHLSRVTLMDEAAVVWQDNAERTADAVKMKKAILEGDWAEVERLCPKLLARNNRGFLYAVYKQQYLEYIEHREQQKALAHLNKRLKPLEMLATTANEFRDICYLLTAKSVHEAPSFRNWEGIQPSRERLVEHFNSMYDFENSEASGSPSVPPNRLLSLLRQAVAYQIEFSRYHPKVVPRINTLLQDYKAIIIPNQVKNVYKGHTSSVKCVGFVGENGDLLVSGSSDNSCRLWHTETGECRAILEGHSSRVWDVSSDKLGSIVASASSDRTVKIWSVSRTKDHCISTLGGNEGDVYTAAVHPAGKHLATGGYDKVVRLYDLEREIVTKTFTGHSLSISKIVFSPAGNLIISGSKDCTIRFWDIVSGLCIKSISSHLGEVTSLEMNSNGLQLLTGSKDNSNRLWDIRMLRPIKRYKGHQNTAKNFVRSGFASDSLVVGGSEDGLVHIWDAEKGDLLQRLKGHTGIVYDVAYNPVQSLVVSGGEDGTLRSWWFDEKQPLY